MLRALPGRCRPHSPPLLALLLALSAIPLPSAADTLIHAGRLIDGISRDATLEQTVVVRDGVIVEVLSGYRPAEEGDTVIDLRSATVLPGLIDLHTHLSNQGSRQSYVEGFRLEAADYGIRSVAYAVRTLEAGFTTVRDVGDRYNVTISLKRAIAEGLVPGPRIFTATKSLATTGGHADPTNGVRSDLRGDPGPAMGVVNSVEDARKAVRQRYKEGADLIKITATGGVLSFAASGQNPQFTEEELRSVVETARDYGFHVAAHAHGTEGMKRAIRAGVRTIEHGTYLDEEGMELMIEHGTYLVPTLLAGVHVAEKAAEEGYYPEIVRRKAAKIGPLMAETFRKAYEKGVPIAFGTDSGVSPHGENGREFALMVAGGMPPMEAIHAATRIAAEVLGQEEHLGTVAPGKAADLVATDEDPLADISALERISFVMKQGVVFKDVGSP
ncbi:MAG: amidohydrolase family protein [Holophagales bacterium]|nr:amidohydrolase family protein [Holophagales bacterium]